MPRPELVLLCDTEGNVIPAVAVAWVSPYVDFYLIWADGEISAGGHDVFDALFNIRQQLESRGLQILVNGARRNFTVGSMASSMGGGYVGNLISDDEPMRVDPRYLWTLHPAPLEEVVSVAEHREFLDRWYGRPRTPVASSTPRHENAFRTMWRWIRGLLRYRR